MVLTSVLLCELYNYRIAFQFAFFDIVSVFVKLLFANIFFIVKIFN